MPHIITDSISRILRRVQKEMAARLSRKLAVYIPPCPIVSFTFDDFPRSALTIAGAMLADKGVRGTYYAAMGLMGKRSTVGEIFNEDDLRSLVTTGHELACHTFSHVSCHKLDPAALQEECARNRKAAEEFGGCKLRNFSFPFGDIALSAKRMLASTYDTCRTVERGINRNPVDLGFLHANPLYAYYPVQELKRIIRENVRQKGWVILYTHDISPNPSPFGCTPRYFHDLLGYVVDSGAEILTVAEAARRYGIAEQEG